MSDASREAMLQHAISVLGTDLPESYRGFLLAGARSPLRRAASGRIWSFVLLCPHAGENGRSLVHEFRGQPYPLQLRSMAPELCDAIAIADSDGDVLWMTPRSEAVWRFELETGTSALESNSLEDWLANAAEPLTPGGKALGALPELVGAWKAVRSETRSESNVSNLLVFEFCPSGDCRAFDPVFGDVLSGKWECSIVDDQNTRVRVSLADLGDQVFTLVKVSQFELSLRGPNLAQDATHYTRVVAISSNPSIGCTDPTRPPAGDPSELS